MSESRFYLQVALYYQGTKTLVDVPFVCSLPTITSTAQNHIADMVVLSADEPNLTRQGLHIFTGGVQWAYVLDQVHVSNSIQSGDTVEVYFRYGQDVTFNEPKKMFRNGVAVVENVIEATDNSPWVYVKPKGSGSEGGDCVKSVNSQLPDATGNVTLKQQVTYDISYPTEPMPNTDIFYQGITDKLTFKEARGGCANAPTYPVVIQAKVNDVSVGTLTFTGTQVTPALSITQVNPDDVLTLTVADTNDIGALWLNFTFEVTQ